MTRKQRQEQIRIVFNIIDECLSVYLDAIQPSSEDAVTIIRTAIGAFFVHGMLQEGLSEEYALALISQIYMQQAAPSQTLH